jgi:DNA-directed RNA polymerase specialized sigma24 family protein
MPVTAAAPRPSSDLALLERIAAGDARTLWELAARYGATLREVAFGILRDASAAEHVVQATFQDVRYAAARFDPAHFPVERWLVDLTRLRALEASGPAHR